MVAHSSKKQLITKDSLVSNLKDLGVTPGMTLLVHSSLRSVGFVAGGPVAVASALEEALGRDGTLVVPTFTSDLTDPQYWSSPAVPSEWWEGIRHEVPVFDPAWTPSRHMGALAECIRTKPGTLRSTHPHVSFAPRGQYAEQVTANAPLDIGFGEGSPLSKIYDLGGFVLLIGLNFESNTSLHLSECRADYPHKKMRTEGAALLQDGKPQWVEFQDIDWYADDFPAISEDFARKSSLVQAGKLGEADAVLLPQRQLVDHGIAWMETNRRADKRLT